LIKMIEQFTLKHPKKITAREKAEGIQTLNVESRPRLQTTIIKAPSTKIIMTGFEAEEP